MHTLGTANGKYATTEFVCHYCLIELTVLTRTVDHIIPRASGGLDIRINRIGSCRPCNSAKSDTWPTCFCSQCRKTQRYHWEHFRINKENPGKRNQEPNPNY